MHIRPPALENPLNTGPSIIAKNSKKVKDIRACYTLFSRYFALKTPRFMALIQKDLAQIQKLLTAQDQRLRLDLREALSRQAQDIKRDICDE
jgi:hypothetical protein